MPESKKRLLIVDDEPGICDLLKIKFQHEGLEVFIAYEGAEGFEKALKEKPDCVLLDIRIPNGQDGLTFLRRARSYRSDDSKEQNRMRNLPVIILTATGDGMRPLFELEGVSDFIEKPFDSKDLKNRVFKVLHLPV